MRSATRQARKVALAAALRKWGAASRCLAPALSSEGCSGRVWCCVECLSTDFSKHGIFLVVAGQMKVSERARAVGWWLVGTALLLGSCIDRSAKRVAGASANSAALVAPRSAERGAEAPAVSAPVSHWGSELLRFASSNERCAALAAQTAQRLAQVRDPFESSSPDQSEARLGRFRA